MSQPIKTTLIDRLSDLPLELAIQILSELLRHPTQPVYIPYLSTHRYTFTALPALAIVSLYRHGSPSPELIRLAREVWFDVNTLLLEPSLQLHLSTKCFQKRPTTLSLAQGFKAMYAPHIRRAELPIRVIWHAHRRIVGPIEQGRELSFPLRNLAAIPSRLLVRLRDLTIVLEFRVVRQDLCGCIRTWRACPCEHDLRECFATLVGRGICGVVRKMDVKIKNLRAKWKVPSTEWVCGKECDVEWMDDEWARSIGALRVEREGSWVVLVFRETRRLRL